MSADTEGILFLAKWSEIRFSSGSKVPSSMWLISFPCSSSTVMFPTSSNRPLSKYCILFDFKTIFSILMRFLRTPTGTLGNKLLEISISLRFNRPSKAPGSIDIVLVFMNSTFSSCGCPTKDPFETCGIWPPIKKTFVARCGISRGIVVALS